MILPEKRQPSSMKATSADSPGGGAPIKCELHCWSDAPHLHQLYTGLADLHRLGRIRLRQRLLPCPPAKTDRAAHLQMAHAGHAMLLVRGKRLYFDMHDSQEVDEHAAGTVDWYFKRSLSRRHDSSTEAGQKLLPWGLNYRVESNHYDRFAMVRQLRHGRGLGRFREILRHIAGRRIVSMAQRDFESPPPTGTPSILFLTRLWDPGDDASRSEGKRRHFEALNAGRAECIRRLRHAFGLSFHGGLMDTGLARELHPELIVPGDITRKDRFLEQTRRHHICVATTGLHGSIGWKLAEYVAMSRCIVSERLENNPGTEFSEGRNYLAFETPDQCVQQVQVLLENTELRKLISSRNHDYYSRHLLPARMAAAAIEQGLGLAPGSVCALRS
jgi:hypothetical protein